MWHHRGQTIKVRVQMNGGDEIHAGILAGSKEPIQLYHLRKEVTANSGSLPIMLSRDLSIGSVGKNDAAHK